MYKQTLGFDKKIQNAVIRIEDNAFIPFDPDNTDYQAYLKWLAKGNEPLPADEVTDTPTV